MYMTVAMYIPSQGFNIYLLYLWILIWAMLQLPIALVYDVGHNDHLLVMYIM